MRKRKHEKRHAGKKHDKKQGGMMDYFKKFTSGASHVVAYTPAEPKHVLDVGDLQLWVGPFSKASSVKPDYYVSLNGGEMRPLVRDLGFGLKVKVKTPKGLSVDWPDYGVPDLDREFWQALADKLWTLKGRLYMGCGAGLGRTGTALAILVGLLGVSDKPVEWVRKNYNSQAVETTAQVAYVKEMTGFEENLEGSAVGKALGWASVTAKSSHPYGYGYADDYPTQKTTYTASTVQLLVDVVKSQDPHRDALKAYGTKGAYEVHEVDGDFMAFGCVGTFTLTPPDSHYGRWDVQVEPPVDTVEHDQVLMLTSSTLLKAWFAREGAFLELLARLGVASVYTNEYKYGPVEVNERGQYVVNGQVVSLEKAVEAVHAG